jgi:hypothetical protein
MSMRIEAAAPGRSALDAGRIYDWLAAALLAALVALVCATFRDYGISNDEEVQHVYGRKLIDFYLSGFSDDSAFHYRNLYLYGGLFDMAAVVLDHVSPFGAYETRHLLSGLIGVGGVAAAWRLARLLAGPRAGFIAASLLAATAVWYGASFNHTKDVPFAVGMTWSLLLSCRIVQQLPRPRPALILWWGAALGLTLGLRVGGLLAIAYLGAGGAAWLALRWRREGTRALADLAVALRAIAPGLVLAYALMAVFWPWSVFAPLNPLRALQAFSNFHYQIDTILAGEETKMYAVPASYLPDYLALKLPLVALAGLGLAAAAGIRRWRWLTGELASLLPLGVTVLAAVFPVAYFVVARPPAYDGIRHFLFVVPPLIALSALGFEAAWRAASRRGRLAAAAAPTVLAAALAHQAYEIVELHPQQYVYYNELVGGLAGAGRDYVTDYWVNTAPEAIEALEDYLKRENHGRPILGVYTVAFCGERISSEAYMAPYLRWTRDWGSADFFISPTHMSCDKVMGGRVIYEVKRLGATLGVVKDRRPLLARGRLGRSGS